MNRQPVVGDCIRVAGKRGDLVVVSAGIVSEEFFNAYVFSTIREIDLDAPNPKVTVWQTEGFEKYGTEIKLSDVTFIRQIKIKQTVTYSQK